MDIAQIAPRQLRIVAGSDWSIPIYCDPYSNDGAQATHWRIQPALELLAGPFAELSSLFSPLNQCDSKRYWIIADDLMTKLTKKVEGCQPEDYLRWSGESEDSDSTPVERVSDKVIKDDAFLKYLCRSAGMDPVIGRYFWAAQKKSIIKWLVDEQRPIRFGPFTVHPMPYRPNWKEIMLAKHSGAARSFFKLKSDRHLRSALIKEGFIQDLGSVDLIGMDKGRFTWSMDVEIEPELEKALYEAESARLSTKRQVKYAKYYEGCIRRRLDDIIAVFSQWLQGIKRPVGRISESAVSGLPILCGQSKRHKVLPSWHTSGNTGFMDNIDAPKLKPGQRIPRPVAKQIKKMFEVPDIRPEVEDMRERGESGVAADQDRGNETTGVLLLHAGEGAVAGSDLLVEGFEPGI